MLAINRLFFSGELLDALFLRQFADEQRIFVFCHDIAFESLNDYLFLLHGMDHAVGSLEETDIVADGCIAIEVFLGLIAQRTPSAKVAPAKFAWADKDFFGFLHDGIVHRDTLAFREDAVNFFLFLVGAVVGQQIFKGFRDGWLVDTEGIDNRTDVPDEDACIPEVIVLLDILLGCGSIRFLFEGVHSEDALVAQRAGREVGLNIAVSRFGAGGLNAQCDDGIGLGGEAEAAGDDALKFGYIHHYVVTGSDNDVGLGILRLDSPADVCNAGSCIAPAWFAEDVACRHLGQLLSDNVCITFVGDNPHVFGKADSLESLHGQLEK